MQRRQLDAGGSRAAAMPHLVLHQLLQLLHGGPHAGDEAAIALLQRLASANLAIETIRTWRDALLLQAQSLRQACACMSLYVLGASPE